MEWAEAVSEEEAAFAGLAVRAGMGCAGADGGGGPLPLSPTVLSLTLACRRIGKDLSNTFAKLEKLTICECSWGVSGTGSGPKRVEEPYSLSLLFEVTRPGFFISAVAKRKSLFDDKAVEIEELTYIIKQVSD